MNKTGTSRSLSYAAVIVILLVLLAAGLFFDINAGYSSISLPEILNVLAGGGSRSVRYTLLELRLPRVIASILVGAGLSASGCILQGITRNDMAEPSLLGYNAGAGLMIAIFIVFFTGSASNLTFVLPLLAFIGSASVAFIEYRLATVSGRLHPKRMLLMGIAVSIAITSLTTILMLRMPQSQYAFVQSWLAGNIWGAEWSNILWLACGLLILILFSFYKSRTINIMMLGQANATSLGVPLQKTTVLFVGIAAAMSALCCAVGGGLSFVGLVCPHLARRFVGPDYQKLLPTSVLTGMVLLVFADIISRSLFLPYEIPIGIVTAVIGAPYFLYLLVRE